MSDSSSPAVKVRSLRKSFSKGGKRIDALRDVSIEVESATVTGVFGADGAGKSTLLRILAGLLVPDDGTALVTGVDVAGDPIPAQHRLGYMPQSFGLYEDLTVQENLDLYADLHAVSPGDRAERHSRLMRMTGLDPFRRRLVGRLSGGMKQKLGLACTLIRSPELLLLDEPTVGVDPVSRRELWGIIHRLVKDEGVAVLLSTAYLDEAEHCHRIVILDEGRVIATGSPSELRLRAEDRTFAVRNGSDHLRLTQSRLVGVRGIVDATIHAGEVRLVTEEPEPPEGLPIGTGTIQAVPPRFEDAFMAILNESRGGIEKSRESPDTTSAEPVEGNEGTLVSARDVKRKFGGFYAVKGVSFEVKRGEIFGLLGPNGAGKSTTFRMLCGLLPVSEGEVRVAGTDLRRAAAAARQRIGYVAQKFSQYARLTVLENLRFFSSAYGLRGDRRRQRIDWALDAFSLRERVDVSGAQLPGGYKQRLAMACALMHEPEILFLDEPTSGVDPLTRRTFWRRIAALAEAGVTVIVTTHFMEEAEFCDRLAIMISGELLAVGTPGEIRERARSPERPEPTVEDAFIALVEKAAHAREEA